VTAAASVPLTRKPPLAAPVNAEGKAEIVERDEFEKFCDRLPLHAIDLDRALFAIFEFIDAEHLRDRWWRTFKFAL